MLTDPTAPSALRLGEQPPPQPRPDEAVVRVRAFSLNRGELRGASSKDPGSTIGWDLAGEIELPAHDGGPAASTPVVAFSRRQRGWAEQVAIPLRDLAIRPEGVAVSDAATLPVAGGTALGCLDRATRLLGRKVLVTGVTGGVGGFGVQLARAAGAVVVAQVRREADAQFARALGAHEIVITEDGGGLAAAGPYRLVMDGIGGEVLGAALGGLEADGVAVTYGLTGSRTLTFPLPALFGPGRAALSGFNLYAESEKENLSATLARLLSALERGLIRSGIAHTADWSDIGQIATEFLARKYRGKVVLTID